MTPARAYELGVAGREELDGWVRALARSRDELTAFIRRAGTAADRRSGRGPVSVRRGAQRSPGERLS